MVKIELKGLDELKAAFADTQKAIPYAVAAPLTWLAKDAQATILEHTRATFKIRKNWLTGRGRYGILVSPASKDHLEANVRNSAPWMMDHAEGTTRYATKPRAASFIAGGKLIDLPTRPQFQVPFYTRRGLTIKRTATGVLPAFVSARGGGDSVVFGRTGGKVIPLYALKAAVRIPKRWFFIEAGMATIESKMEERMKQATDRMLERFKG